MKTFKFELDTPYRRFYSADVEAITLTLMDGEITVYANHAFFTAPVQAGFIKIKDRTGTWKNAFISEGILEVKGHNTILMVNAAEWPEEIDRERAEKALAAAEETIQLGTFKFETITAETAARRAKFRIKVKDQG